VTARERWDDRHRNTPVEVLSWFQTTPTTSLELIEELGIGRHDGVIDIGGGVSTLAGTLIERGSVDVTVLDISQEALTHAAARLPAGSPTRWVCADIRTWEPPRPWRLWHDRAVFHFLTDPADRDAYLHALSCAVAPGGAIVIGTFAPDGPDRCSGLRVERYDAARLVGVIGTQVGVDLVTSRHEVHITPGGVEQPFTWVACRRRA
jgi:trans-aconitate methyltransferase